MSGSLIQMMPYRVDRIVAEHIAAARGGLVSIRSEVEAARRHRVLHRLPDDELIALVERCVVGRASMVVFDARRAVVAA